MILAVDFDDTLHNPRDREPGYIMGKPMPGAKEVVDWIYAQGGAIIVFCVWADTLKGRIAIARWMDHFHIPYQEITAQKPGAADYYIDDRNLPVGFTDWYEIKRKLEDIYGNAQTGGASDLRREKRPQAW